MYVQKGINFRHVFRDSLFLLTFALFLAMFVDYVHDVLGYSALALPTLPVTTIGVVVSLYLGFKTTSAYNRWWEARKIWGSIVNDSRTWAQHCLNVLDLPDGEDGKPSPEARQLIRQHLAWVNALSYQLRKSSRLKISKYQGVFDNRIDTSKLLSTSTPDRYQSFLSPDQVAAVSDKVNPAVHIVCLQGKILKQLRLQGHLDDNRFVEMSQVLARLYDNQGKCERIKNTPFPRQITYFGRVFTWVFIVLLPFAFVEAFEKLTEIHHFDEKLSHEYMLILIPFNMMISWVFYLLEKVSDSCEDPFEGGATDVPISHLTRVIETDLLQMIGETDIPKPYQPHDGVLY